MKVHCNHTLICESTNRNEVIDAAVLRDSALCFFSPCCRWGLELPAQAQPPPVWTFCQHPLSRCRKYAAAC